MLKSIYIINQYHQNSVKTSELVFCSIHIDGYRLEMKRKDKILQDLEEDLFDYAAKIYCLSRPSLGSYFFWSQNQDNHRGIIMVRPPIDGIHTTIARSGMS